MRQATSQPPSKPMHPRFLQVLQGFGANAVINADTDPAQRNGSYGNLPEQSRAVRADAEIVQPPLLSRGGQRGRGRHDSRPLFSNVVMSHPC